MRGMDIIVVTSANTDDEARELLAGFEFRSLKRKSRRVQSWLRKVP